MDHAFVFDSLVQSDEGEGGADEDDGAPRDMRLNHVTRTHTSAMTIRPRTVTVLGVGRHDLWLALQSPLPDCHLHPIPPLASPNAVQIVRDYAMQDAERY